MILVRDVFHLKFGKARNAVSLRKEVLALAKKIGYGARSARLLTDLVGPLLHRRVRNKIRPTERLRASCSNRDVKRRLAGLVYQGCTTRRGRASQHLCDH
jgi:hypothetical protein